MKLNYFKTGFPTLITLLLLLCSNKVFAQLQESHSTYMSGTAPNHYNNNSIPLAVNSEIVTEPGASIWPAARFRNLVSLQIIEKGSTYISSSFTAKVNLEITFGANGSSTTTPLERNLEVNYEPGTGEKYNARQYIYFEGAAFVKAKVVSIEISGIAESLAKDMLVLENKMDVSRELTLNSSATPLSFSHNINPDATDELSINISWPANAGNNAMQLEWVWLEDELEENYKEGGSLVLSKLFTNNATRVEIPFTQSPYNIPLYYDGQGKVYYRVRPVLSMDDGTLEGLWTYGSSPFSYSGHETSLNWQVTTSFAEEGKRKSVMQYYDGSLRNRQTITKDNLARTTIVAETLYDEQGRPAVQILPAPTMQKAIQYTKNLNLFNGQAENSDPLNFFDLEPANAINFPAPMSNDSGAARYYSDQNSELYTDYRMQHLPDAEGYVYTLTRYTPDATGRVLSQSGVGKTFRMGGGRETKYFYGSPAQEELDGLFGTEVGNSSHYFKNMVQDANGQMSVSYVDMHGRTIATALAGEAPENLSSLDISNNDLYPNQGPEDQSIIRNLLSPSTNIVKGNLIESVSTILAPAPTIYTFTYQLDTASLQLPTCTSGTRCYDLQFDLEFSILNESGDSLPVVRRFTNITMSPDDDCATPVASFRNELGVVQSGNIIQFAQELGPGSYLVRKTLQLSEASLAHYKQMYLQKALCVSEQEIIDSLYNEFVSQSGCDTIATIAPCTQCLTDVGDSAQFRNNYLANMGTDVVDSLALEMEISTAYKEAIRYCQKLCDDGQQILEIKRALMLADMMPFSGQYAVESVPGSGIPLSLYNQYNIFAAGGSGRPYFRHPVSEEGTENFYRDDLGNIDILAHPLAEADTNYLYLATLDKNGFNQIFNTSWANALLPYHPEFGKLKFAEDSLSHSYIWINRYDKISSWSQAADSSLLYANAASITDPFYSIAPSSYKTTMAGWISNDYMQGLSMWQIAYGDVKCKTIINPNTRADCYSTAPKVPPFTGLTGMEQDLVWQAFKSLYSMARNQQVDAFIDEKRPVADDELLVENGYLLRFPNSPSQFAGQAGWDWYPTSWGAAPDTTQLEVSGDPAVAYASQCSSYVAQWTYALLQCDSLRNHPESDSIIAQIISGMIEVCEKGSDARNPLGASEVAPQTPIDGSPRNFEQVIHAVFTAYQIPASTWCNAYVIENPGPYGKSRPLYPAYVSQLDSCHCERFDTIQAQAQSAGYSPYSLNTLNQFLQLQYQDTLSSTLYAALLKCSELGPYLNCDTVGYDSIYYVCDSIQPSCPGDPQTLMSMLGMMSGPEQCIEPYVWNPIKQRCELPIILEPDDSCFILCPVIACDTVWADLIPLVVPELMPSFLECGFVSSQTCFSCAELSALTQAYKDSFAIEQNPGSWYPYNAGPLFYNTELNEVELAHNQAFARFLNYRTGLKLTWRDYALLADSNNCNLSQYLANQGNVPDTLIVSNRSGNNPGEYVAIHTVNLEDGFDSGTNNQFVAYLANTDTAVTDIVICIDPRPITDTTGFTDFEPPCEKAMTMAVALGQEIYRIRTENLLGNFEKEYRDLFAQSAQRETFTVSYQNLEYHYTLYYYDQAGNLVKTVPPRGVNPDFSPAFLEDVAEARASNSHLPRAHGLVTEYRYNSLNQVIEQHSPDGGTSQFWYDRLGRLVVSQNAQQQADGNYSYTRYDALGRIVEVGQKPHTTAMTQELSRSDSDLEDWLLATGSTREQITLTGYDHPWGYELYPSGILADSGLLTQRHLRNRVSWTMWKASANVNDTLHIASFYTYDIHGNVDTLLQDLKAIWAMRTTGNRFKRMTYQYDLISGKVNGVNYQPGQTDAYYHRYRYDAENRLTEVETSRDSIYWEQDASYSYYKHGPLARTVLGELQVQGLDYAYTLQGWMKGLNSSSVGDGAHDMGRDGYTGAGGDLSTARDLLGFSLHYFDDGSNEDYVAAGGQSAFAAVNNAQFRSLYNGNIAGMSVNNAGLARATGGVNALPLFYRYEYDQLNRLLRMRSYKGLNNASNQWTPLAINDYNEDVVYDPNGNILQYSRNGSPELSNPTAMDDLAYEYYSGKNQLKRVTDAVSSSNYTVDIDQQTATENYVYDAIGNLIEDKAEGITAIDWTVYGKISSIAKSGDTIRYVYDAAGNRVAKMYNGDTTVYVRDASGNVMSVYERKQTGAVEQLEVHLYGSSRLGMVTRRSAADSLDIPLDGGYGNAKELTFTRAEKIFELSNHLGNVLVTISDRRLAVDDGNGDIAYYEADVVTANDYYPFGMLIPGRGYSSTGAYRYGFNGKEQDPEVKGTGAQYDYGFRIYDPRVSKFLSVDPLTQSYPWYTPYQFAGNMPIWAIDLDGLEEKKATVKKDGNTAQSQSNAEKITWDHVYRAAELSYKSIKELVDSKSPLINNYWNRSKEYKEKRAAVVLELNTNVESEEVKKQNEENVTIFFYDISYLAIMPGHEKSLGLVNDILNMEGATVKDKALAIRGVADLKRKDWSGLSNTGISFGSILLSYGGGTPDIKNLRVSLLSKNARETQTAGGMSKISADRLHHIFGKSEHNLDGLVRQYGSQANAYRAVQNAANQALKNGRLTPDANGILPTGNAGNIINVGGSNVRLIGGRVEDGKVILSSFSRKGL